MNHIVVARYEADVTWLDKLPDWVPTVIQKQTEELEGDMPNVGREPAAFLYAIMQHYDNIKSNDVWAFVQDNPFDHCPDLLQLIYKPFNDFEWLGGDKLKQSDGDGKQDHPNLPVARLYTKWLGKEWADDKQVSFAPGGQFIVKGSALLQYPPEFYEQLYDDVCEDYQAWVAERLWESIFNEKGVSHG